LAAVARAGDAGVLFKPHLGINRGAGADPIPNLIWESDVNDSGRKGAAPASQTEHELNWPELADYLGVNVNAPGTTRSILFCPLHPGRGNLVSTFWGGHSTLGMGYAYFAHVEEWPQWTNYPDLLANRNGGTTRVMLSDKVFRWTGGGGNWSVNHSDMPSGYKGTPKIESINQVFGDGHVERRSGSSFDPELMEQLGSDPETCRWVNSSDGWQDKFFF
jgi:hypothetical protein